jgi:hypothetical protein
MQSSFSMRIGGSRTRSGRMEHGVRNWRAAKRGAAELEFAQHRLADEEQHDSDMVAKTTRLREQRLA